jgi:Tol biopolymer transport system component
MPKSRTQHKRQLDQDLEMNGRQRRETTQQAMADGGERWHWRYSPDSGKIVFISSDQKRFSVVRDKLEKQW